MRIATNLYLLEQLLNELLKIHNINIIFAPLTFAFCEICISYVAAIETNVFETECLFWSKVERMFHCLS